MSVVYRDLRPRKYYVDSGINEVTFFQRILKNKLLILDSTLIPASVGQIIDIDIVKNSIKAVPDHQVQLIPKFESDKTLEMFLVDDKLQIKDFVPEKHLGKVLQYHNEFIICQYDMETFFYVPYKDILITYEELIEDINKHFKVSTSIFKYKIGLSEREFEVTIN